MVDFSQIELMFRIAEGLDNEGLIDMKNLLEDKGLLMENKIDYAALLSLLTIIEIIKMAPSMLEVINIPKLKVLLEKKENEA